MREHGLKLYKSMGLKNVKPDAVLDKKGAAGKGKSEQVRQEELEKFFAEQEELQVLSRSKRVSASSASAQLRAVGVPLAGHPDRGQPAIVRSTQRLDG